MNVITSGSAYLDIDAYAGIIAYSELCNAQGTDAIAASNAVINESITETIQSWGSPLRTDYVPSAKDEFTLIDVSDPAWFNVIVDLDRVTEVIDHHPGFENYWNARLGDHAQIELVGAVCTQVYERWVTAEKPKQMSQLSARLLIFGILDNTLNFGAQITTDRDKNAYEVLRKQAGLPNDHVEQYFQECQTSILANPVRAIQNDSKEQIDGFDLPVAFGQMVVWDADEVVTNYGTVIKEALSGKQTNWLMNIISIGDKRSTLFSNSPQVKAWLGPILDIEFDKHGIAVANRLWLRKEINRASLDAVK